MAGRAIPREVLQSYVNAVSQYGGQNAAARALNINRNTFVCQLAEAKRLKLVSTYTPPSIPPPPQIPPRIQYVSERTKPQGEPVRHYIIPDTQVRPGVPTDHLEWIGRDIARRTPDVIIVLGDFFDFPSLNSHAQPGSAPLEGARFKDDLDAGNVAFAKMCKPINDKIEKTKRTKNPWNPRKIVTLGNHEDRADRVAIADPKWMGHVGSHHCNFLDFEVHPFLERVWVDGIVVSHYFQNSHSKFPIGGEISNRLAKIGSSFIQGHEQGKREGNKIMGDGRTTYGLSCGSCYLHQEDYRGRQGQRHWRGTVVLNEVCDGEYDQMSLSMNWLCREYAGATSLFDYMMEKYPNGDWNHLRRNQQ